VSLPFINSKNRSKDAPKVETTDMDEATNRIRSRIEGDSARLYSAHII